MRIITFVNLLCFFALVEAAADARGAGKSLSPSPVRRRASCPSILGPQSPTSPGAYSPRIAGPSEHVADCEKEKTPTEKPSRIVNRRASVPNLSEYAGYIHVSMPEGRQIKVSRGELPVDNNGRGFRRLIADAAKFRYGQEFQVFEALTKRLITDDTEINPESSFYVTVQDRSDPASIHFTRLISNDQQEEALELLRSSELLPKCPSALFTAIKKNNAEMLYQMLKKGADVAIRDAYGRNLLEMAVMANHQECAKLLLEAGSDPNGPNGGPLRTAIDHGNLGMVESLLESRANPLARYNGTPLLDMARGPIHRLMREAAEEAKKPSRIRTILSDAAEWPNAEVGTCVSPLPPSKGKEKKKSLDYWVAYSHPTDD